METKKLPQIKILKHPREFCFVPYSSLWTHFGEKPYYMRCSGEQIENALLPFSLKS